MQVGKSDYFQLHIAVLLFSLCALFAYWVNTGPIHIVFGRTFFASLGLAVLLAVNPSLTFSSGTIKRRLLILSSILLVLHWLTFFYAVQQASVSVALITFASYPLWVLFISLLRGGVVSPWTMLGQALLIILGVALVTWNQSMTDLTLTTSGVIAGIVSAMLFAWLTFLNQTLLVHSSPLSLTFWQNALASFWLLPFVVFLPFTGDGLDVAKLLLLGVVFTALSHTLLLNAMRTVPAFLVSVSVCLEPAYGILAAAMLFSEPLTLLVIIGMVLVLISNVWALKEQQQQPKRLVKSE
ncbi:DMT family transporter [Thalassotalea sp. PS06]|uniref:DMT family transporter n=1 Tax=Thalassotalea sp. PS06 TaxID=2594005 RepID=UPI0011625088|nr:DMT family transporter [Thalassotalea sp. PS06]QDP02717.1 DMT family transporter [Thalassotalea sp. PS06]